MDEQAMTPAAPFGAPEPNGNSHDPHSSNANSRINDLAYDIKAGIDSQGRFSSSLTSMSKGLAAGADIPEPIAKKMIVDQFSQQYGKSPMEYLDNHRNVMEGLSNGNSKGSDFEM